MTTLLTGAGLLSGCGEPLSDTDKEIRRAQKETVRLKKKLDRMGIDETESYVIDLGYYKSEIEEALRIRDWQKAKELFQNLIRKDINLGSYPSDLEAHVLDLVKPLSGLLFKENYSGYDLLSVINPDKSEYAQKAGRYKSRLITASKASIAKLSRKYDKVEGISWYHHPHEPNTGAYFYIGKKKGGRPWLRLRGEYTSEYGWLFVSQITAWYDCVKMQLLSGSFERKNTSRIWEWQDVNPTDAQINIMRSLANSDDSILRFEGDKRNYDLTLKSRDKQTVLDVLDAFEAMNSLAELKE